MIRGFGSDNFQSYRVLRCYGSAPFRLPHTATRYRGKRLKLATLQDIFGENIMNVRCFLFSFEERRNCGVFLRRLLRQKIFFCDSIFVGRGYEYFL
jgi:hypothetical protein